MTYKYKSPTRIMSTLLTYELTMPTREQQLNQALEAMHFGFRAMVYKPDQRLNDLGLSRIHHRLLYFIGRNSNCSISELLQILDISKQYMHRPLKQLINSKYVIQTTDSKDRRIKRLRLSTRGARLEFELSELQRQQFDEIFRQLGPQAEKNWHQVMQLLGQAVS
ncbi:MAG: DNA-binding MarR family transcriptional regulator [Gammaproteobacteria bacterium]|jgi:DNA-binding MarR family transcriptional regulator